MRQLERHLFPCEEAAIEDAVGTLFIVGGENGGFIIDTPSGMENAAPTAILKTAGDFIASAVARVRQQAWHYGLEGERTFQTTPEHCDGLNLTDYTVQLNILHRPATPRCARAILRRYRLSEPYRDDIKDYAGRQFESPIDPLETVPQPVMRRVHQSDMIAEQICGQQPLQTVAFINGYPADATELPELFQTHEFITMEDASQNDFLTRTVSFGLIQKEELPGRRF